MLFQWPQFFLSDFSGSICWDTNGNLLADGVYTYTYDAANRPVTMTQGTVTTYTFSYNGDGARLKQKVNSTVTTYTVDLAAGLTQVLMEVTSSLTNTYLYGAGRLAQQTLTSTSYFLGDGLGSVRQLADASGEVTLVKSYQPYGSVLSTSGSGSSSYGFTGEWTDNTGLVYLRARYYAPGVGRFISRDIWAGDYNRPLTLNAWLYVLGNPINLVDPSGLKQIVDWSIYRSRMLLSAASTAIEENTGRVIDIAGPKIGFTEIQQIIRNFEGNPYTSSGTGPISGVDWYDCTSQDVIDFVNNRVDPDPVGFDLNRYDWLFSGWASYWEWRKPAIYPVMPDMANVLKAISFRESTVGYQKINPQTGEKQSLLNFGDEAYYRRVSTPNADDVREWDSTWGLMAVSTADRWNPIMEVGATVRFFYAMYFYYKLGPVAPPTLRNAPDDRIFRRMGAAFGEGDPNEIKACYGAKIWSIAKTGKWYAKCKEGIDYNDALVDTTSNLTVDLW